MTFRIRFFGAAATMLVAAFIALLCGVTAGPAAAQGTNDMAVLHLTVTPDPTVAGGFATYDMDVDNTQGVAATNARMTFTLPAGTRFSTVAPALQCSLSVDATDTVPGTVLCNFGTMQNSLTAGGSPVHVQIVVKYDPNGVLITSGNTASLTALAVVASDATDSNSQNNNVSIISTVTRGADLGFQTFAASPATVIDGGVATFTTIVTNFGPYAAADATVTFTIPVGLTWQSGSGTNWSCSATGQTATCHHAVSTASGASLATLTWSAKVTGSISGTVQASASVTSTTGDGNAFNNIANAPVNVQPGTDLAVTKSVNKSPVVGTKTATFTLNAKNLGPNPAQTVTLSDTMPAMFSNVQVTSAGGWTCTVGAATASGTPVDCSRATFAVGSDPVTVTVTAPDNAWITANPGNYTNSATIGSATVDADSTNNTGQVSFTFQIDGADLAISSSRGTLPITANTPFPTILTVTNNGPEPASGPVYVTYQLAATETLQSYTGTGWSCSPAAPTAAGVLLTCQIASGLAVGAKTPSLTLNTQVSSAAGAVTNTVCTSTGAGHTPPEGDINPGNDCTSTSSVTISTGSASLSLSKTVAPTDLVPTADTLTYTLTVTNNGPDQATNVIITDTLPMYVAAYGGRATGTTFSITSAPANTCSVPLNTFVSANNLSCNVGTLANGAAASVIVAVKRPMLDGNWTNTAYAYSQDVGSPGELQVSAQAAAIIEGLTDVELTQKTVNPTPALAGTNVIYTIQMRNNGPSQADNVTITDTFTTAAGNGTFSFVSATASNGGTCDPGMTGNAIACSFGTVPYKGVRTMTLTIRPDWMAVPPTPRQFTNTAVVATTTPQSDTTNDSKSQTLDISPAQLDLLVHESHAPDPITWDPSATNYVVYDVYATNNGPSYATGVKITDSYTTSQSVATLTFKCDLASKPANAATACASPGPQNCSIAGSSVECSPDAGYGPGNLTATATVHRFLVYSVDTEPLATGTSFTKTATVAGDEHESNLVNNTNTDITTVRVLADVAVTNKVATPATVDIDQSFVWTVTLQNNGPGTSHNTRLTDNLPAGMVLTGAPTTPWTGGACSGVAGGSAVTCSFGDMAKLATTTVTIPVKLTTPYSGGATVSNKATVATDSVDTNSANDSFTGIVNVNVASIAGTVFVDTNDDGVQDNGEAGIANVKLSLSGTDSSGNPVSASATTGGTGAYKFDNLPPSDASGYKITEVQPNGYLDGQENLGGVAVVGSNLPGNAANDTFAGIVLASSAKLTGYNFGEIAGASIGGKVWHDQNNDGLIDNGESTFISGVKMKLGGTDDLGNTVPTTTTTTASDGSYSFSGLRPGIYTLTETQPAGYIPGLAAIGTGANGFGTATTGTADNAPGAAPGSPTFGNVIASIGLRSGDAVVNYNFGELLPASLAGMVFYDINNSGAQDQSPSEPGISGANVTLAGTDYRGFAVNLTQTTDANGLYAFANVPPSNGSGYTLTETVPAGYGDGKVTVGKLSIGSGVGTATPGTPGASDASGTDVVKVIVLTSNTAGTGYNFGELKASISGTVFNDPNNDGKQQAGEAGIPGVTITLSGCGSTQTTTTDGSGNYIFAGIPACASYAIVETQPANYSNGLTIPGSVGGNAAVLDTISGIDLAANVYATAYNFSEHGKVNTDIQCVTNSPGSHNIREPFDWVLTIQNIGGGGSPNTLLADTLPPGLELVGTPTSSQGSCTVGPASGQFKCAAGFVLLNQSVTVTAKVRATAYPTNGTITNQASVTTDGIDTNSANNNCSAPATIVQSTLSGTVFSDPNNNGVQDSKEPGIGSVAIALTGTDAYGNAVNLTTTTAADGTYKFTGLAPASTTPGTSGYTVTETQPPNYAEGQTIAGSLGGGVVADVIGQIPVTAGVDATGYNFAEIAQGLAGKVYVDLNNNGQLDPSEPGIPNVTLAVTGTDSSGNPVNQTAVTGPDGTYLFGGLNPSNATGYTLTETQPAVWADGKVTAGSAGGLAGVNVVTSLVLPSGRISTGYNFGEIGAKICGYVYEDLNNSGIKDPNESGIPGVTMTLTGVDANGLPVSQTVSTATLSAAATDPGRYCFTNLPVPGPGGYTITETPPANSIDGKITPGGMGGVAGTHVISQITFTTAGGSGDNYNFAILLNSPAALSGFVWLDGNHDRQRNEPTGRGGWIVQLVRGDVTSVDNVIATTVSATDGSYKFSGLPPGTGYSVLFRNPNGGYIYGFIPNITLTANVETTEQNQPIDPSGVVYDAVSRVPVAGAVVKIVGPLTFDASTQLLGGSANAVQATDATGEYKFLLLPNAPAGTYSLQVTVPSGYMQRVSTGIPPCAVPLTVGGTPAPALVQSTNTAPGVNVPLQSAAACPTNSSGLPAGTGTSQYFLGFVLSGSSANVVNNHIPIEPNPTNSALIVTKTTPKTDVTRGDLVPYTITVRNNLDIAQTGISVVDQMPPGFKYRTGSASINGVRVEPVVSGNLLTWANQTVGLTMPVTVKLLLIASASASDGEYTNTAWASNGFTKSIESNIAYAKVRITADPTFDCSDIIGKVFDDANRNGSPDDGEHGIANVRLVTVNGQIVTTDADGRFHIACADVPNELRGSNYVLKLDPRSLPTGYRMTTENPMSVRLTRGKMAKMNFGAAIHRVVRIDVADAAFEPRSTSLQPRWSNALAQVLPAMQGEQSVLRIAYSRNGSEDPQVAQRRVDGLITYFRDGWKKMNAPYDLVIETEIVGAGSGGGSPPTSVSDRPATPKSTTGGRP